MRYGQAPEMETVLDEIRSMLSQSTCYRAMHLASFWQLRKRKCLDGVILNFSPYYTNANSNLLLSQSSMALFWGVAETAPKEYRLSWRRWNRHWWGFPYRRHIG